MSLDNDPAWQQKAYRNTLRQHIRWEYIEYTYHGNDMMIDGETVDLGEYDTYPKIIAFLGSHGWELISEFVWGDVFHATFKRPYTYGNERWLTPFPSILDR